MCGLWIYTIYPVTSYLRLLASSILTCSPNMSFLAPLVWANSRSLEKFQLGTLSSPSTPKEKFFHGVEVLVCGYLCVKFDPLSSINFSDINGFPKLGAQGQNPY